MSKLEFTPEPWEFRHYSAVCSIVSAHNAPGRIVRDPLKGVQVSVDVSAIPDRVIYDDQSNAHLASPDARLIVSAPSLYSALEGLLTFVGRGIKKSEAKAFVSAKKAAASALKKARGEV